MADILLSESLIQNNADSQGLRDPFQQARSQYDSRKNQSDNSTLLSSSPIGPNPNPNVIQNQQPPPDFRPILKKIGVEDSNIALNDIGKFQLDKRLKQKFNGDYSQNKDAMAVMDAFNKHLDFIGDKSQKSMNESLANAQRTLGALFGNGG